MWVDVYTHVAGVEEGVTRILKLREPRFASHFAGLLTLPSIQRTMCRSTFCYIKLQTRILTIIFVSIIDHSIIFHMNR